MFPVEPEGEYDERFNYLTMLFYNFGLEACSILFILIYVTRPYNLIVQLCILSERDELNPRVTASTSIEIYLVE